MKKYLFLAIGTLSFLLSFFIPHYFIQFIVAAIFFSVLFIIYKNSEEIESLKKTIEEHNSLIKEDIEILKKDRPLNWTRLIEVEMDNKTFMKKVCLIIIFWAVPVIIVYSWAPKYQYFIHENDLPFFRVNIFNGEIQIMPQPRQNWKTIFPRTEE